MKRILVVSDTHGDESWLEITRKNNFDFIIHAGDHLIGNEIKNITPYYVDGNNDWGTKNIDTFKINNQKFLLLHGDEQHLHGSNENTIVSNLSSIVKEYNPKIVIFGHTHIPFIKKVNNIIYLNPGSMWYSRNDGQKHYIIIEIDTNNNLADVELKTF